MTIRITNQKPVQLYEQPFDILPKIKPSLDAIDYSQQLEDSFHNRYIKPLFTPINQNSPVSITDSGQTIDEDTITRAINHLWQTDTLDVDLQDQMGEIYRQSIQYHAQNDWYFDEQLGIEAITRNKLPVPSNKNGRTVKYSAAVDVIPAAKSYLATPDDTHASAWFANLTAYTNDREFKNYLVITMQSADAFNEFKELLDNLVQAWRVNNHIDPDTTKFLTSFNKIDLTNDLSSAIFLPNGGGNTHQEQEAFSFTRMMMYALAMFEQASTNTGRMNAHPANIKQVYMPENIIFLNLENYAHAKASDVKKDWDDIEKALRLKKSLNFITGRQLMTAEAINRSMGGGMSSSATSKANPVTRTKIAPFSGKPIPAKDLMSAMKKIIASQITGKVTENTYKTQKQSYMRANRRKPDDINMPGKLTTVKYRPDIHIYLDTSGSISEDQYRDAITNLIHLTKRIDCNLYMSSFSHVISQTALIRTKGLSTAAIYKRFLQLPKVNGGTDFENVWTKIDMLNDNNERSGKSHQINFIITDFGYSISSDKRFNPTSASVKHTYYVPISIDTNGWSSVLDMAKNFKKQLTRAGDRSIRSRMIM